MSEKKEKTTSGHPKRSNFLVHYFLAGANGYKVITAIEDEAWQAASDEDKFKSVAQSTADCIGESVDDVVIANIVHLGKLFA
jgi:hypothetical protein